MAKPPVFIREATGLVRSFSMWDAFFVSVSSVGACIFSFASQINYVATANPGADYFQSEILGFFLVIPMAVTYMYVAVALPRSGADYVWSSRLVHPFLGFFIGFWGWIGMALGLGSMSWIFSTAALPNTIATFGYALNIPYLVQLTSTLSQTVPGLAIAIGVLLLSFIIGLGAKIFHRAMTVITILIFLGVIVSVIVLGTSSHADFVNAVNGYGGTSITYDGVIKAAEGAGWSWSGTTWGMTVASIPLGYLLFLFPANSVLVGGEIKNVSKSIPFSVFATLIAALLVDGVCTWMTQSVVGFPFIQASMNAAAWPLAAPSWAITWMSILANNNIPELILLQAGWLLGIIAWCAALFLMASRYIFALSFDRAFPPFFADVDERFHFPLKAAALILCASIFFLFFTSLTSYVGSFLNVTAMGCVTSAIACVGAILLPYKMKGVASILPGAKWKIPFISIVGAMAVVVDLCVFYFAVTVPAIGPSTPAAYILLIVIFFIGMGVFALRAYQLKRQGFSLKSVYSQIPPE